MPIVVGVPRSGTTLLRFMLDAHPELAIPPETGFLKPLSEMVGNGKIDNDEFISTITNFPANAPTWPDFGLTVDALRASLREMALPSASDAARCFYRLYAAQHAKVRWGDKTPAYGPNIRSIAALLPEARFIHIIRDGRDVAASLRHQWFAPSREVAALAEYWRDTILATRRSADGVEHYVEIFYEDLVSSYEIILKRLCTFLELPFDTAMMDYYVRTSVRLREHGPRVASDGSIVVTKQRRLQQQILTMQPPDLSRVDAWRTGLSPREARDFVDVAGDLLTSLGYENA